MATFVGINGLAGAGKSTAANFLLEGHYEPLSDELTPAPFVRVKMSEVLKDMLAVLLRHAGVPEDKIEIYLEGTQDEKLLPIPELESRTNGRHLMKTIGSEWRDLIYSELWVGIAVNKIIAHLDEGLNVVADDIRFEHEINYIHRRLQEYDVRFVKIEGRDHEETTSAETHQSELPMSDHLFDAVISNDRDLEHLYSELHEKVVFHLEPDMPSNCNAA
jgi:hypothetical protein